MKREVTDALRLLFRPGLYDIKSGFFICEREVLAHILKRRFSYAYFQTFVMISARHKGYRIEQIETLYVDRKLGKSFLSIFPARIILRTLLDSLRALIEFRLLSAHTDVLADFLATHPPVRPPQPISFWRRAYLRLFALLMPVHHWVVSTPALRYYHQLRRTQWLSRADVRTLQEERPRATINAPTATCRSTATLSTALGIAPDDINSPRRSRRGCRS